MKHASQSFIILSTLVTTLAVFACSDGRKSSTLDRRTALTLLHEAGPQLLERQATRCDLKTREVITPASGWNQKRGELTIAFLDLLVEVGILKDKTETKGSGYTLFTYSIIPQEHVATVYPNTDNEIVLVTLAKPIIKEIVGIRQEGAQAIVETGIAAVPTPLYSKVLDSGKELFAQCQAFPSPKPYFCGRWPSREALEKPETRTFQLARYDDGWRVLG
jgi:hypothetical protein